MVAALRGNMLNVRNTFASPMIETRTVARGSGSSKDRAGRKTLGALCLVLLIAAPACVSKTKYDRSVADLGHAREGTSRMAAHMGEIQGKLTELEEDAKSHDAELSEMTVAMGDVEQKLEDMTLLNAELTERLRTAGQSVEHLAGERGSLTQALDDARQRLERLRALSAMASAHHKLAAQIDQHFADLVTDGNVVIVDRDGAIRVLISNDMLFQGSTAKLTEAGENLLNEIAGIVTREKLGAFQVAAHSDNTPPKGKVFPSNWALTPSRAVNVTHFLTEVGVPKNELSAAGYGEHSPHKPNDTDEGKKQNRRVELVFQSPIAVPAELEAEQETKEPEPSVAVL